MKEHRQIVERWQKGAGSILITLTGLQGSSYRQPGARLLTCKDGSYAGGISAGCLEGDLLQKAPWLTRGGTAVERYSTLFDDAAEMPFGLGCGGVLDLLLEPVETAECNALLQALAASLDGRGRVVTTWLPFEGSCLQRAIFSSEGEQIFASEGLSAEKRYEARLRCFDSGASQEARTFVERLLPPQRLFVFGAGDDAKPLVTIAHSLGWKVTVCDGRPQLARKARFPEIGVDVTTTADSVVVSISPQDAVVIMSHSFEQDRQFLTGVLAARPRYLGLLGSRQRSALLIAEAAAQLEMAVSECCSRICAPVGLNIGGEGPEAIALAIIAEVQAVCAGKGGVSRKLSAEQVSGYVMSTGATAITQTQCSLSVV